MLVWSLPSAPPAIGSSSLKEGETKTHFYSSVKKEPSMMPSVVLNLSLNDA